MLPPAFDPAPLARLYREASPHVREAGRAWYRTGAARVCSLVVSASGFRLSRAHASAVIALLSPRQSWRRNVIQAIDVGARIGRGEDAGGGPGIFRRVRPLLRAVARPGSDPSAVFPPSALKTSAFFRNLCGDLEPVTVDVWAARAAGAPESADLSDPGTYGAIAQAYREASAMVGDAPASLQAVTWCAVRGAPGVLTFGAPLVGFGLPAIGVY